MAALVKDLKQRGLLDDTLVIWGGEFGRTPMRQGTGRRRQDLARPRPSQNAYTMWLAGGGIKPGVAYGQTDDFGFNVVENPVHVHDLHATILHLLGLDHERLTFRYQGRDFRLTDVHGKVVREVAGLTRHRELKREASSAAPRRRDVRSRFISASNRLPPCLPCRLAYPSSVSTAAMAFEKSFIVAKRLSGFRSMALWIAAASLG